MEAPDPIPSEIFLTTIDDSLRVREEYGDLSSLKYSIKEYGLIQPLVVTWDENRWKLLVGGRRYKALVELGRKSLIHGKEILIREELYDSDDPKIQLIRATIEMEENLKRKEMTWAEQVAGKKQLLELLQQVHGVSGPGKRAKSEEGAPPQETGFSVRKLASVLGEAVGTVSQDLQIAEAIEIIPDLAKMETKTAALNRARSIVEQMKIRKGLIPAPAPAPAASYRILVYCKDEADQVSLAKEMESKGYKVDLVIV